MNLTSTHRSTKNARRSSGLLLLAFMLFSHSSVQAGCIVGQLLNTLSENPVNWATVRILELNRAEPSHDQGGFLFCNIRPGTYTIEVSALGYRSLQQIVHLESSTDTINVTLSIEETTLQVDEVVIIANREGSFSGIDPSKTVRGSRLQLQLASTLAATIGDEPGVAQQSMGPAAARPVIRGMGGDRLTILEDGTSTGDASSLSADHAVSSDPLIAKKIEVLRGPASFLYSSNALGGIINVSRDNRITNLPDQIHGEASLQAESVNRGVAGGAALRGPIGPIALFLDGTYRDTRDIHTPDSVLENTDLQTIDLTAKARLPLTAGTIGLGGSFYRNHYGIPGGFVGAHPGGVRIEMKKQQYFGDLEYHFQHLPFRSIRVEGSYTNYYHREIESGGIVGTEYGILTSAGSIRLNNNAIGTLVDEGTISLQGSFVDFAANGVQIPQTDEERIGLSILQRKSWREFALSGALRFDSRTTTPSLDDTNDAGIIRERSFTGLSGGLTLSYAPVHPNHTRTKPYGLALTLMRTWRVPDIQELYSDGPHLASYSYEVGNTGLEPETGLGAEVSGHMIGDNGSIFASFFWNDMQNFILAQATGDTNIRTRLPLYRHSGVNANFIGGELEIEQKLFAQLTGSGSVSWVRGGNLDTETALPFIPPLHGRVSLRHQLNQLLSGITLRWAASQNRVGEFEEPTSGYISVDVAAQLRFNTESTLHTIVISINNIFNTTYYNHLSRIKSVYPEPGRNGRLLYRFYF